jgi:hypothetical protein
MSMSLRLRRCTQKEIGAKMVRIMQRLLVLAALFVLGAPAAAQVVRCVDAAGAVSYTDDKSCPSGTKQSRQVLGAEATPPRVANDQAPRQQPLDPVNRATPQPLDATAPPPASPPGGLVVIDPRSTAQPPDSRWSDRSTGSPDNIVIDDGYGYPGGYARPAAPPREMRPRLTNCGPSGCQDRQGNSYDRSGRLTQFQRPDGRTCQQVGTTQVCR